MSDDQQTKRCAVCGAPADGASVCERCADRTASVHPAARTPLPREERQSGIILENKYRLMDELGRGGMGTVFKAVDESLDRLVAVKFLLPEHQAEPALVKRFQREAKAMASVRHENVLQIYSFGSYGSTHFFVMEYIEGQTLDEMLMAALGRRELLSLTDVIRHIDQMCAGLAAIHRAGVVHRDIKPGNVMVHDESQRAVIMDFGIGRRYLPGDARRTMSPGGTPAYMAPEVIASRDMTPTEERLSDLYALGVTAFELVTGALPFTGETWVEVFQRHLTDTPPAPSSLRAGLPAGLDDVILQLLAKAPPERFKGCDEVREALAPFLSEERPAATPPPAVRQSKTPPKHPRASAVSSRTRIVVADPDPGFRTMVYQCAEDVFPDCKFQAARTTLTALDIARTSPPLVLFAPLDDAQLNGLEFAATLWADNDLAGVRVVLTAERIATSERRMLEEMGIFKVVVKPVTQDELRVLLQDAAASPSTHQTARPA